MNNDNLNELLYVEDGMPMPSFDEKREKRNFSRLGFGFALFSLISLAVSLVIQVIVLLVAPEFFESKIFLNMLSPVSMYLFALPVLLLIIFGMKAEPPKKRRMGFWKWVLFLIIGFGLMYIGNYIGQAVMFALSNIVGYDYSNALNSLVGTDSLWATFIFMVIVAPIGEEFVFRKLLIDRTQKYGGFVSVLLSGLIFGLMHGNFYQFFYAFALGLLLGYVYYSTGKIHLTIAIHAVINFFGSVVASLLTEAMDKMYADMETLMTASDMETVLGFYAEHGFTMLFMLAFMFFVFAAMICAIVLPIVLRKKIVLEKGEIEIPKGRAISTVVLNAGMIVMLVVYILEFVLNLIPAA